MSKARRNPRTLAILLLLGVWALACRLIPATPETATPPPPPPPASETPAPRQPAPAPTSTPQQPTETPEPTPTPRPPTETPAPTETSSPEPTQPPAPTLEPTPSVLALKGPIVSLYGTSFAVDPALGDEVFAVPASDSLGDVEFSFAPDGYCRQVGCITVYPVEAYREEILFGADIVDGLESAIQTRSNGYFPVLMAHILLRAQTRHLRFQNGTGMRALVMKGQNTVFANNESIQYEFLGQPVVCQYRHIL